MEGRDDDQLRVVEVASPGVGGGGGRAQPAALLLAPRRRQRRHEELTGGLEQAQRRRRRDALGLGGPGLAAEQPDRDRLDELAGDLDDRVAPPVLDLDDAGPAGGELVAHGRPVEADGGADLDLGRAGEAAAQDPARAACPALPELGRALAGPFGGAIVGEERDRGRGLGHAGCAAARGRPLAHRRAHRGELVAV